jgi:hypothetical protein
MILQYTVLHHCQLSVIEGLTLYYWRYVVAEWFTARLACLTYRPVTNVCAVVWFRSQLAALMFYRIKGIFDADHVTVVSSGHSGFFHHQNGKILISLIIGSSEGRFRSRDERMGAEKM